MRNHACSSAFVLLAALFPATAFAQSVDENWLRALSMQSGMVSASSEQWATFFGAAAELRRPHIPGAYLRAEVGGWRADNIENGERVARWDQTIGIGLTRAFGHSTGRGSITPSLGIGLGLHSMGREDPADGTSAVHSSRTLHPSAFMDGSIALHLTRSELFSLEVGGCYAVIADAARQASMRVGVRLHPGGGGTSSVIRNESPVPAAGGISSARVQPGSPARSRTADGANAVELNIAVTSFTEPTQMTKERSDDMKKTARAFIRSDENAGAEIVAYTSAVNLDDASATLRAATVARMLAGAGIRTDRLRIVVRVADEHADETDNVRVRITH